MLLRVLAIAKPLSYLVWIRCNEIASRRRWEDNKGIVSIDTVIDEAGRSQFVITLDKETVAPAGPGLKAAFRHVHQFIFALRDQIRDADAAHSARNTPAKSAHWRLWLRR
jgi:hypothetical protein